MNVMRSVLRTPSFYVVLAATVLLAVPFHLQPDHYVVDDGYFYPQIARHITHGAGSTFNGIMPTNGYHPLWMLVCVAAASITSAPAALVQILGTTQDLLLLACLLLLVAITNRAKMRGVLLGCIPLLFIAMVLGIWRLLETTLSLTLQLGTLLVVLPLLPDWYQSQSTRLQKLATGAMLGMAMLARLDLIFFAGVILAYNLVGRKKHFTVPEVFLQGAIASAFVLPYLGWNWLHFHHLLPISGAIKSTFPYAHAWSFAPFTYPVLLSLLVNTVLVFKRKKTPFETASVLLACATALQMAYSLTFGELAPWYLTTGYLGVAFSLIWCVNTCLRYAPRLAWLESAAAITIMFAFLGLGILRLESNFTYTRFVQHQISFQRGYIEPKHALAEKLRQILPAQSRIFIFDAPGGVALYSGMSLLPADGLVADYAYNSDVVREGFCRYAGEHGIQYFIAPYMHDGQTYDRLALKGKGGLHGQIMSIQAPLTRKAAGEVQLHDADLVFRAREINPELETQFPEVGVWRLNLTANGDCSSL